MPKRDAARRPLQFSRRIRRYIRKFVEPEAETRKDGIGNQRVPQNSAGNFLGVAFRLAVRTRGLEYVRQAPSQVGAPQAKQADNELRAHGNDQAHAEHHHGKRDHGIEVLEGHNSLLVKV